MNTNNFAIGDLFRFGWMKTKNHFWFMFLVFVFSSVVAGLGRSPHLLTPLLEIFIQVSYITVILLIVRGATPVFADLFNKYKSYKVFLRFFLATLALFFIIGFGFLLLIIPGIYLLIRLQFVHYLIVDKEDIGVIDAIKMSMQMTKGRFWQLLMFVFASIGMNIVGFLCFVVGLAVTSQVTMIAYGQLYTKLEEAILPVPTTV